MFTFLAFYWRIIYYSLTFTSIRLNQKAYLDLENRCWIQISSSHLNQHVASFLKQKISEICIFFWRYSRWGGRWSWRWCCNTCCCCRPGRWCVAAGGTGASHQWSQSSQTPSQVTCLGRTWLGSETDKPWSGTLAASGAGWCQRPHSAPPHRSWTFPWKRIYKWLLWYP